MWGWAALGRAVALIIITAAAWLFAALLLLVVILAVSLVIWPTTGRIG